LEAVLGAEPDWLAMHPEAANQYRLERAAVNDALNAGGIAREQALLGTIPPSEPDHFSVGSTVAVNEDQVIIDDLAYFPRPWRAAEGRWTGGRVFEHPSSGRRLAIVHANKNRIETTNGVDLVYFVADHRSFIFVQYKRARKEGNAKVIRPDDKLDDQLARMRTLEIEGRDETPPHSIDDLRLADACSFFKLCDVEQPEGRVFDLSEGKYVSLALWDLMESQDMMRGSQDGRCLRYDKVIRYYNNSAFAGLVSEGWVGTRSTKFEPLMDLLFEGYEAGRSLVYVALSLGDSRRRPGGRPRLRRTTIFVGAD
jgi:hypothetical protein